MSTATESQLSAEATPALAKKSWSKRIDEYFSIILAFAIASLFVFMMALVNYFGLLALLPIQGVYVKGIVSGAESLRWMAYVTGMMTCFGAYLVIYTVMRRVAKIKRRLIKIQRRL